MDDVQRLRTVTSLDVSAVAWQHAMPAALLSLFAGGGGGLGSRWVEGVGLGGDGKTVKLQKRATQKSSSHHTGYRIIGG